MATSVRHAPAAPAAGAGAPRVLLGTIVGVHGVRGHVKVRSHTADPAAIASYGPLSDAEAARSFQLRVIGLAKGNVVAQIEGVNDRDAAERLRGVDLYVGRDALPAPEEAEEYYQADLIGLAAVTETGAPFGTVVDVRDFGAGDLLEIRPAGGGNTLWLPFTRAAVPVVDLGAGRIVVAPPSEVTA